VGRHPVTQKARGGDDDSLSVIDAVQIYWAKPIAISVLANFYLELIPHPDPLACARTCGAVDIVSLNCFRHPSTPFKIESSPSGSSPANPTLQTRQALAPHYYCIREEATSRAIILQFVLCQEIDVFLTLFNIYTADPYFRVPLFIQFTYVSVWWQWDRKQNTAGFFPRRGREALGSLR
jgi:hypothetical protein